MVLCRVSSKTVSASFKEKAARSGGTGGGEMTDEKRVAVVTGAAQGIGRRVAVLVGYRVLLV